MKVGKVTVMIRSPQESKAMIYATNMIPKQVEFPLDCLGNEDRIKAFLAKEIAEYEEKRKAKAEECDELD